MLCAIGAASVYKMEQRSAKEFRMRSHRAIFRLAPQVVLMVDLVLGLPGHNAQRPLVQSRATSFALARVPAHPSAVMEDESTLLFVVCHTHGPIGHQSVSAHLVAVVVNRGAGVPASQTLIQASVEMKQLMWLHATHSHVQFTVAGVLGWSGQAAR